MSRLSVVEVMGWPSRQYGSVERFLVELSRQAVAVGMDLHVVFHNQPTSAAFCNDLNAAVHVLPAARYPADPRFINGLRSLLGNVRATHLHAHFGLDAYLAVRVARRTGVRRRYATKHINPAIGPRTLPGPRHRWLANHVETIFTVSHETASRLVQLGVPRDKIVVSYLGVDTRVYRPDPDARAAVRRELGVGENTFVVLATSHLRPGKGVEIMPQLAAAIRPSGDTLVLVAGEGELRQGLDAMAQDQGLGPDRFRLLGGREDVPGLLQSADLFAFPTSGDFEGFGMSAAEALATGVPAVLSGVADIEVLFGGVATVVPPGDTAAFIRACQVIRQDPTAAQIRARRARDLVTERLTVSRAAEQHLNRYLR